MLELELQELRNTRRKSRFEEWHDLQKDHLITMYQIFTTNLGDDITYDEFIKWAYDSTSPIYKDITIDGKDGRRRRHMLGQTGRAR